MEPRNAGDWVGQPRRWVRACSAAVWVVVLGGCAGQAPASDGGTLTPQTSPAAVCRRLAAAKCSWFARCFPAFRVEREESCRLQAESSCVGTVMAADALLEAQALVFTPDRALGCAATLENTACSPTIAPGSWPGMTVPQAACLGPQSLFDGRLPPGAACAPGFPCAGGAVCVAPPGACGGVCLELGAPQEACGAGCRPGLTCGAQARCVTPAAQGEPCRASSECDPALRCVAGACQALAGLGEECAWDPHRESTCQPGLACDQDPMGVSDAGTCLTRRGPGQPCRFHATCGDGLVCAGLDWSKYPRAVSAPGTCQSPQEKGAPCTPNPFSVWLGETCAAGLSCSPATQTCEPLPQLGEACTVPAPCAGADVVCRPVSSGLQGVCARPPGLTERCAFPLAIDPNYAVDCGEGWCDQKGTQACRPSDAPLGAACQQNAQCASLRCMRVDGVSRCVEACR